MSDELKILTGLMLILLGLQYASKGWRRRLARYALFIALALAMAEFFGVWWYGILAVVPFMVFALGVAWVRTYRAQFPAENILNAYFGEGDWKLDDYESELCEYGYEWSGTYYWEWLKKIHFVRIYWNPLDAAIVMLNIVEVSAKHYYVFYRMDSVGKKGTVVRTCNYPLNEFLHLLPGVRRQFCRHNLATGFGRIRRKHLDFVAKTLQDSEEEWAIEDPDAYVERTEWAVGQTMAYNAKIGILRDVGAGRYEYTWLGVLNGALQVFRDMIRWS